LWRLCRGCGGGYILSAARSRCSQREQERQRGIARRADAKVRESMSQAETIQEFWMESRKLADSTLLSKWQTRQDYVEALLGDLYTVLDGRSPDREFIQDVDDELKSDLAEFGEAGVTPILLIGNFWKEPDLLVQLTSGDTPSAIFAKFGFLVSLLDLKIHQNEFMDAQIATPVNATVIQNRYAPPPSSARVFAARELVRLLGYPDALCVGDLVSSGLEEAKTGSLLGDRKEHSAHDAACLIGLL
jgi:hypothetical protein